jgi:vacuolar-type H+-ATPase subunit E/Vma4
METTTDDTSAIVSGILADAEAEGARLVAEAELYGTSSATRANDQAATIAREAAAKAAAQAAAILADAGAKLAIERRRRTLLLQEGMARDLLGRARTRLDSMIGEPGYRDVLLRWIGEAAVGLSAASATVAASAREMALIDDGLLREAAAYAAGETGEPCALRKAEGVAGAAQGVYLVADGGRFAYDNRMETRFERERGALRKLIYKALFDEGTRA